MSYKLRWIFWSGSYKDSYLIKSVVLFFWLTGVSIADVIKPTLAEISIYTDQKVEVVINLNLEAMMTGIGTQYKNTTDAPTSTEYDKLRNLSPEALRNSFKKFELQFLNDIQLSINHKVQTLHIENVKIDFIGYKKRPRKTVLTLTTQLDQRIKTLTWQYLKDSGDSALRYQVFEKNKYNWQPWQWLRNGESSNINITHHDPVSAVQRLFKFIAVGFNHVLTGWDHILFIIGIALFPLLWKKLLLFISVFTLAHSLSLGLSMFGLVEISPRIIEPLIAFSITYVAIENLFPKQSIPRKSIIIFLFGLVHGLGFADMLKNFEMQIGHFSTTLIGFNIGVELAQIVIVLSVISSLFVIRLCHLDIKKIAIIPFSILIALVGFWWGIQRLLCFVC